MENFLKSNIYPLILSVVAAVVWMFSGNLEIINRLFIVVYLLLAALILATYKDTSYAIPIFISLLFMVNTKNLGLQDIRELSFMYIISGLVITGLTIHILRFRHKFNIGFLSLGFLLIAISYFLPMLYIPFSKTFFTISTIGFLYLAIYLFILNTSYSKTETILRYFFFASFTLLIQLYGGYLKGLLAMNFSQGVEAVVTEGLTIAWGNSDLGYGNINDVIIFLTLLSAGQIYMIFKYPKKYFLWIFPSLSVIAVILSGSRGGWISWAVMLLIFYVLIIAKGTKEQFIIATSLAILALIPMVVDRRIPLLLYRLFRQGGIKDFDTFSSFRLTLYKNAFEIFKKYPYFGAGWTYALDMGNSNRIQVYHSTVFHTIAVSGLFGVAAVAVLIISQLSIIVKKLTIYIAIAAIAWLTTFFHGLMDNTIHMLIYTILTIFLFTSIERDDAIVEQVSTEEFPYIIEK
ncbi:MAG: O-antigen ligase family protein [Acholeplasmatales bacterium]